eukprot:jgi/Tetstr1/460006/TSEL_005328.t1
MHIYQTSPGDVMTSVWRSIPGLKQSLDADFHPQKDVAVLRQPHEDRLDEIAAEVELYEDIVRKDEAVAAVEAAEAQAEVSVVVMAVDAAMEAHPEADEDRAGTLDRVYARQCCPPESARNPELRMRQPGWDAQREQLTKRRPQGFEPAVEQEAPASYEGRRGGGSITSDMLDIRNQQLLQHLRTALQHAKLPGLPVAVVLDMTPEHVARWLDARDTALRGGLDTRDHMAVAWKTVLQQAVHRFEATAQLTWVDYSHLDLTRVFAAAVQSVYGLSLPRISVPPLSLPSVEPQASIHPVDVVQHGVKPLESRRQLSATSSELQQMREVQRSAYPDYPEYDRHSAFYVDCKFTVIVIGGVRILMALLDTATTAVCTGASWIA